MRLAQIPSQVAQLAEDYEVKDRLTDASRKLGEVSGKVYDKVYDQMGVAGEAAYRSARKGAVAAYHTALEHPRASIGGIILAAALIGGALWYVFGDWRRPQPHRRSGARVRARTERRKHSRAKSATA